MNSDCNMNISLVDDDMDCLAGLNFSFGIFGHTIKQFTSPQEALDDYKKNRADIVITDFLMPDINGIDLILKLREINPHVKVILITAYGNFPLLKNIIENKIYNVLFKPIKVYELHQSIDSTCEEIKKEKLKKQIINDNAIYLLQEIIPYINQMVRNTQNLKIYSNKRTHNMYTNKIKKNEINIINAIKNYIDTVIVHENNKKIDKSIFNKEELFDITGMLAQLDKSLACIDESQRKLDSKKETCNE